MKKTIMIIGCSILILSFGDSGRTSFSQKTSDSARTYVVKPVSTQQVKEKRFAKDTSYLNMRINQAIDSLTLENEKTNSRIKEKKETIKIQKMNERDLSQISKLLSKGLIEASTSIKKMPVVHAIDNSCPKELDVNIKPLNPDSLVVPKNRKRFFDFLKFWQ